jgi:hypothetical protein
VEEALLDINQREVIQQKKISIDAEKFTDEDSCCQTCQFIKTGRE